MGGTCHRCGLYWSALRTDGLCIKCWADAHCSLASKPIPAIGESVDTVRLHMSNGVKQGEQRILDKLREATKEAWRAAALRAWYDCIDCGSHIKVDEDGCCATCGRDADFIDLDYVQRRMTTIERVNEELRCEVSELRASAKRLLGWSEDSVE